MTLGQKLKTLLKEKNMTQEELAEQLDVSRQAVGKWVNDKGIPEVDKLIQISNMFGVTLDYLLKEGSRENTAAEGSYYVSEEMLEGYLSYCKQNRKRIVGGLALIMVANIFDVAGDKTMQALYWLVMLSGLALWIWQYFQTKKYQEIKRERLLFDGRVYEDFKMRRERERKRCGVMAILGMVLLIAGTEFVNFLTVDMQAKIFGASPKILIWITDALTWITDAAGLSLIVWAAMSVAAETVVVRNTEETIRAKSKRFVWIYWAIPVTALAVLVGFVSHIWSPMAPIIVLLCALLVTVCKLLLERREER